jgi:hypothetical protein
MIKYIEFQDLRKDRLNYTGINQFGYGLNISTPYKVTCNGKTYRLKATCISNNISYWIKKQGEKFFIDELKISQAINSI